MFELENLKKLNNSTVSCYSDGNYYIATSKGLSCHSDGELLFYINDLNFYHLEAILYNTMLQFLEEGK